MGRGSQALTGRESETGAWWGTSCEREDGKECAAGLVKSCACHSSQISLRVVGRTDIATCYCQCRVLNPACLVRRR